MKTRKHRVRELHFKSGAGAHGKSEKAKRRAAKVAIKNEY